MLRLRPHHILDIVRNIGNDRPRVPHPYGHLVHVVTERIIADIDAECELVVANDDICGPCRMFAPDGSCTDVLAQLDPPIAKQTYNDELDRRLLEFLRIESGSVMTLRAYLELVAERIESVAKICAHPKERVEDRKRGLEKGLTMLL